jgi:hypothetical protein
VLVGEVSADAPVGGLAVDWLKAEVAKPRLIAATMANA